MSTIEERPGDADVGGHATDDDVTDEVADEVSETVDENPFVEHLTRLGWIAKGVVYILMGGTAISIAQSAVSHNGSTGAANDQASPKGALDTIIEQPGGRLLLGVLAVGLALYALWRFLSVAVIRSDDLEAWADRIGYTFSGLFYGFLAFVAARGAIMGADPGRDNSVEKWSRRAMDWSVGRWLLMAVGVGVLVVGVFFVVRKGIMRSFCDDLAETSGNGGDDHFDKVLVIAGVVGWIGRGIVTILVGFFIARAAWRFDPNDAAGFDGALRKVAASDVGGVAVWIAGVGLVVYGAFCLLSHRRRRLAEYVA